LFLHLATVLSTIIVFRKDILSIIKELFQFKFNEATRFVTYILISMLPVFIVGIFFKDAVESFYNGNIAFVGAMLIITGLLLLASEKIKAKTRNLNAPSAFIIGIAQAIAVLPGISRSGATIATGLISGVDRSAIARFSFLMVIPPIIGASILDVGNISSNQYNSTDILNMGAGFIAAFLTGLFACKLMIRLVKNSKLIYFAIYCFLVGSICLISRLIF